MRRLLIANRGEIVVRVARTARALGLDTVAVLTPSDAAHGSAPHARAADRAVAIGSYLSIEDVLAAAARTQADAVHPGYGFLAENADFARLCVEAGLVWVGPPADAIEAMGDKAAAKKRMASAGVPVIPGEDLSADGSNEEKEDVARSVALRVGLPLLIKAVAGGGGRGLRRVDRLEDLAAEIATARSEAESAFGDGRLMLERLVEGARHVEIQILADGHGHVVHLGERDCTAQRRHQKIVEESPSPPLEAEAELRRKMCDAAVRAAMEVGYVGAGTVEMLLAPDGAFYFLEMNTRLQVEHPVTEMRTGLDLVAWQLRVAQGETLPGDLGRLVPRGHAIEARVYAEDPALGFAPHPGTVLRFRPPQETPGVLRVDHALEDGVLIPPDYDPMLAKVIVHGHDRADAIRRLDRALAGLILFAPATNIAFLRDLLRRPEFTSGDGYDTGFVEREMSGPETVWTPPEIGATTAALAAALLSERHGDRSAGAQWGWRNAAGTEGWNLSLDLGDDTRDVRLVPQRPRGRDPRDVLRANVGEDVVELDFVRRHEDASRVRIDGVERDVHWSFAEDGTLWLHDGETTSTWRLATRDVASTVAADPTRALAPMTARVQEVRVAQGDRVEVGQCLVVLEAMKLETRVEAEMNGTVAEVLVGEGDQVARRQELVRIDSD